jgi:hypothetical protein
VELHQEQLYVYHFIDPSPDRAAVLKAKGPMRIAPVGTKGRGVAAKDRTVHIYDCSGASRMLAEAVPQVSAGFAATAGLLVCPAKLPYALLTSCLLTPSRVALLWQSQKESDFGAGLLTEIDIQSFIELLRSAPEAGISLLQIVDDALEAIADQIAMEALAGEERLFVSVFRSDPLRSRLFYRYLFAARVLRSVSMTPVCFPELPDMNENSLWDAFDLQVDRALYGLRESVRPSPRPFKFTWGMVLVSALERLELWLACPSGGRRAPRELGFLPMLLENEETFARALCFVARFLKSSVQRTREFLLTRSFPVLITRLPLAVEWPDNVRFDFMVVIASCCIANLQLAQFGKDNEPWLDFLNHFVIDAIKVTKLESRMLVALTCLLLFEQRTAVLERNPRMLITIEKATRHRDHRVRCLSHLLLANCNAPFPTFADLTAEPEPLVRAAMVIRSDQALRSPVSEPVDSAALQISIAAALSDMSPIVRTEAIVAIALGMVAGRFGPVQQLLLHDNNSPLSVLLREGLYASQYDPSPVIQNTLSQLIWLIGMPENASAAPTSSFKPAVLLNFAHTPDEEITIQHFQTVKLEGHQLRGHPAISPSGILSCADTTSVLRTQAADRSLLNFPLFGKTFDIAGLTSLREFSVPARFSERPGKTRTTFVRALDDARVMAISHNWQVSIVDTGPGSVVSFWIPDSRSPCAHSAADYNFFNARLIHTANGVAFSDLREMRRFGSFRLPAASVAWVKWHPDLFIAAGPGWRLYDARTPLPAIVVDQPAATGIIGGNSSAFVKSWFLIGEQTGTVGLWDIRAGAAKLGEARPARQMSAFDVHGELPFALGLFGTELGIIEYATGKLHCRRVEHRQIDGFALHTVDPCAAVRTKDEVVSVTFDLRRA